MNTLDLIQVTGVITMIERFESLWLGIAIPTLILILSILAVWGVFSYYNKKQ